MAVIDGVGVCVEVWVGVGVGVSATAPHDPGESLTQKDMVRFYVSKQRVVVHYHIHQQINL